MRSSIRTPMNNFFRDMAARSAHQRVASSHPVGRQLREQSVSDSTSATGVTTTTKKTVQRGKRGPQRNEKVSGKYVPGKRIASIPVGTNVCRLLDLPPELRTRIYEYVFTPTKKNKRVIIKQKNFAQPALLRTCKAIRNEACSVYYLDTKFQIDVTDYNSSLLQAFTKQMGRYMDKTNVEVKIMQGARSWGNLVVWLEAFHQGTALCLQCEKVRDDYAWCVARWAFDMVVELKELPWEKVIRLLEVYRKASEQTRTGKWVWA